MSLRQKLLLALVPLVIALAVVGLLATATISSLGRGAREILKDNYLSILCMQRMNVSLERLQEAAVQRLVTAAGEPKADDRARAEAELQRQENNITEPGEAGATRTLRQAWDEYLRQLSSFVAAEPAAASAFYTEHLEPAFNGVRTAADAIRALNQDAIVRKSDHAQNEAGRMTRVMIIAAFMALLIGAFLSVNLTNRLLRPLQLLTRTVNRIGEGDFDSRVEIGGRDELAQLAHDVNTMAARLSQYRRSSLGDLLLAQQAAQAAIDSLPDPVIIFDRDGSVLNANRTAESLLGVSESDAARAMDQVDPAVRTVVERARAHVMAGKGAYAPRGFDEAVRVTTKEGESWLLAGATPVYAEQGGIQGASVVLHDVTRLRRVDELRDDLVATLAHEFRTPLTSLQLAIHLLIDQTAGSLNEKQLDLVYAARSDCDRLRSMVDDILDLSRIQSGRIEMHPAPTSAAELVKDCVEAHRGVAAERAVVLEAKLSLVEPGVLADRERIALVLGNLVSNALRHTPVHKSVQVRASSEGDTILFEVADSGPGIPPEYQRRIFDKFFRVPGGSSAGAGLGLSIAKDIVEAHGGTIGVKSAPDQGSTFWFTLKKAEVEESV
ncbi:MAG: HAMP domain-containing protein [Deltaproteobacteria bacterium]|nr:HAMP domain-containing protein [Deltaproteobacteria bacterium]